MDFGRDTSSVAIRNPAAGHSPYIDEKAGEWADTEADILSYLSDVTKLEAMADKAANATTRSSFGAISGQRYDLFGGAGKN